MFTGSIVAIVTPMDEKGNVCRASLKKLIDYHVASGTSAIVSVGTTGESATLNHDEHADVVMMTLELADGRIPVIAGTGANATAEAISLTQRFNDSGQLHAVIRRVCFAAGELLFVRAVLQYGAPAAGTGVAGAGAVGVDGYCFHGRPPWWVFELVPWSRDQCDSGRDLPAG